MPEQGHANLGIVDEAFGGVAPLLPQLEEPCGSLHGRLKLTLRLREIAGARPKEHKVVELRLEALHVRHQLMLYLLRPVDLAL